MAGERGNYLSCGELLSQGQVVGLGVTTPRLAPWSEGELIRAWEVMAMQRGKRN